MKRIIVDTNLLCLVIVGLVNPDCIKSHKRLRQYSEEDFNIVMKIMGLFAEIVTCPQILTETSNLTRLTEEPLKTRVGHSLSKFVENATEFNHPAVKILERAEFSRLGFADAVILMLAEEDCFLLSDDLDICLAAAAAGYPTINYNYIRDGSLKLTDIGQLIAW